MKKILLFLLFSIFIFNSCKKDNSNPVITNTIPSAPTLLYPTNVSTSIEVSPIFSWNESNGSTSYTLQVSLNSSFTSFTYNQNGITNTSQQVTILNPLTIYYWRVSATNSFGTSDWSAVRSFTTTGAPPEAPILTYPTDGSIDISMSPLLEWSTSSGADSYTLQLSNNNLFTSFIFNQSGLKNRNQRIYSLSIIAQYYWRLSATNKYGTSGWSNTFTFTSLDPRPVIPILQFPPNYITVILPPKLSWSPDAKGLDSSYTLQVSTNSFFTSLVYNQSGLKNTYQQINSLDVFTQYYWRVSATNSFGTSDWSKTWNYSTGDFVCGKSIFYSNKTYNSVFIAPQCWLKENLDVGTMIDSSQKQTNNSIIEKYCYRGNPENCTTYGGLYQWNEAMQYVTTEGTQGICPTGWHIPTNAEFQTLQTAVNNDGNALKAIGQGTGAGAGTNTSGFSAFLTGRRNVNGEFDYFGTSAFFWSSRSPDNGSAYYWNLESTAKGIGSNYYYNVILDGYGVRCIKD